MIRYAVLGSGSCGNSYVFYDGTESVLVDCGFSLKELKRRLEYAQVPFESVKSLFLTHLHPDHGCGAGVFARKTGLPVVMSRTAHETERTVCAKLNIPAASLLTVDPGTEVRIGPFVLNGFSTTHDSAGSMGWRIDASGRRFLIVTDTGTYDDTMVRLAGNADVLFLESNYDEQMLRTGPYPYPLKKRIAGTWGHLSNEQALEFLRLAGVIGPLAADGGEVPSLFSEPSTQDPSARQVYFIHLSAENNDPSIVASGARRYVWYGAFTVCERGKAYVGELA